MGKGGNILTFGAIDTPSLDYVKPRWKMIDFALKNNPEDLKKAEILYDKIVSKIEPGYKPGDKYTTNEATANELRELYKELDKIIQPYGLGMKNGGGTGYNKLYNTKALLDKNVRTVLYGSVGNDPEGEVIRKKMKAEGIELVDNGLTGSIPSSIGELSMLRYINVGDNQISGPIPNSTYGLTNLEFLMLWKNILSGFLSPSIGNMAALRQISLENN